MIVVRYRSYVVIGCVISRICWKNSFDPCCRERKIDQAEPEQPAQAPARNLQYMEPVDQGLSWDQILRFKGLAFASGGKFKAPLAAVFSLSPSFQSCIPEVEIAFLAPASITNSIGVHLCVIRRASATQRRSQPTARVRRPPTTRQAG